MNAGPGLIGALVVLLVIGVAVGVTSSLHQPGACYVGKAAWMLSNPC